MQSHRFVVVYSGGLDSTVLLGHLTAIGHDVIEAVSIDYGQRHAGMELDAAAEIARTLNVVHHIVSVPALSLSLPGSALTDANVDVPHGHYEAESMQATVVPNRNMILIAIALGRAVALECDGVAIGAHTGDHAIYADCRPEFLDAMDATAKAAGTYHGWGSVILAPFVRWTKAEIVQRGTECLPRGTMERTWSCYEGDNLHCGKCGTCVERREAFVVAGAEDLTTYRA